MAVPYTFGTATAAIPLSQLDSNFATAVTIGNTAVQLGNTVTTLNNLTLANVTISSGSVTITNVSVTTANATTANVGTLVVTANATVAGNVSVTGNVSMNVATITTANVSGTANVSSLVVLTNETVLGNTAVTGNVTASINVTGAKLIPTGTSVTGNGLYLPAANALGLSTNGTNAVYIDASQNVGIGTASPATKLQVAAPSSSGAVSNGFAITNAGSGSGTGSSMFIGYNTTLGTYGSISGFFDGTGTSLTFGTTPSAGGSAVVERMRIDSSGNVGIGTATASAGGLLTLNKAPVAAFGNPIFQLGGASFTSGGYYSMGMGFTDATYTEPPAEIATLLALVIRPCASITTCGTVVALP